MRFTVRDVSFSSTISKFDIGQLREVIFEKLGLSILTSRGRTNGEDELGDTQPDYLFCYFEMQAAVPASYDDCLTGERDSWYQRCSNELIIEKLENKHSWNWWEGEIRCSKLLSKKWM